MVKGADRRPAAGGLGLVTRQARPVLFKVRLIRVYSLAVTVTVTSLRLRPSR